MKTKVNKSVARLGMSLACASLALLASNSNAQVLLSGGAYSQNFNTLSSVAVSSNLWANNVTLPGWYANCWSNTVPVVFGSSADSNGATNIISRDGAAVSGALYSFGPNALADRALGSLIANAFAPSGFAAPGIAYGIRFTNNTGVALTNFLISYTGEQWRNGGAAAVQSLGFSYRVDSTPIVSSDPANTASWTSVPALDFNSPTALGAALSLDGNNASNRVSFVNVPLAGFVVLAGQEIFIRWGDRNDAGNDHGLAIDDVSVSFETNFAAVATAPVINTNPASVTIGEGKPGIFAVSVGGTAPLSYFWYSTNAGVETLVSQAGTGFTTNNVPIAASGTGFYIIVTNAQGAATSTVATLTVTNIPIVVTNIQYLRTVVDGNYVVNDTNTLFQAEGIVTTPVNLVVGTPAYSFHIQSGGYGMDVFHRGGFPTELPAQGDLVRVTAQLLSFNGLLEFAAVSANPTHKIQVLSSGNPVPAAQLFNFGTSSAANWEYVVEGSLVVISNVYIGKTNGNALVLAGETMFLTNLTGQVLRMVNPVPAIGPQGTTPPAFAASVTGVISQNTGTLPATNGYSVLWTTLADVVAGTPPAPGPTPENIVFATSGSNLILSWAQTNWTGLMTGTNVTGVTNAVIGATSPYTNSLSGSENYFRLYFPIP